MFAETPGARGVVGISVTPGYMVGPSQAPGKLVPLGVLGVLAVLGVLGVLGVLVAWACATAGAMSTAAIESKGEMGSFFKAIPRAYASRTPGHAPRAPVSNEAWDGYRRTGRASSNGSIAL